MSLKILESELKISIDKLWVLGIVFIKNICAKQTNNFWKDVFQSWSNVYHTRIQSSAECFSVHVWYIGVNSVVLKNLFNLGTCIVFIYDFLDANGII